MENLMIIGIAILSFAVTNIDDIFILMAYYASPTYSLREIVIGQYLGIGALTLSSFLLAWVATTALPEGTTRWLGLIPFLLGIKALFELTQSNHDQKKHQERLTPSKQTLSKILSVTAVTIANGGDNMGVYIPLFSSKSLLQNLVIIIVFCVMTALWCWVGHFITRHPLLGQPIRRWGHIALPCVLVGLGIMIIFGLHLN